MVNWMQETIKPCAHFGVPVLTATLISPHFRWHSVETFGTCHTVMSDNRNDIRVNSICHKCLQLSMKMFVFISSYPHLLNVNETLILRSTTVNPFDIGITSVFRGVIPCVHVYRLSFDKINKLRRGNHTDT